jgi:hypothetical protein
MRTLNRNPEWHCQPLRLNDEERQHPESVLDDFFSCFHLQDMREILWDWLVAALSGESGVYNSGFARSNLIFVYEKLELLVEAAHLMHKRRKKRMKKERRRFRSGRAA